MLQITNYRKAYGAEPVLTIPELALSQGTYWLKGENGAGKSTLLRSIAGLIPFDGDIRVDNINLRKQRMAYTRIVSLAEAEPVYPSFLTGADLLLFYRKTKGENILLQEVTGAFGMQGYLKNKIGSYSSGMLKKLSLLLAFAGSQKLILLDEPFITLDADAVRVLQNVIADLSEKDTSFIISSHQELGLAVSYGILKVRQHTIQKESDALVNG